MKRILCIVGSMNAGGAETFLMKIYRKLDREKYQMDFCVSKSEKGFYDDEISNMGGRIIHTVPKSKNPIASFVSIYNIVKKYNYKYIMRVSQHSLSALELLAAKLAGAEVLVYRSSNSSTMGGGMSNVLHKMFRFLPRLIANVKIAPSLPASEFMFGEKLTKRGEVIFLKNGIPLNEFTYSTEARKKIRDEIHIKDQLLIGHIGRFSHQKNHEKLVKIFYEVKKYKKDAHLMLVGTGELEVSIKNLIHSLKLDNSVHFMGVRKDIPDLLSAMDVFVFPSLFEGMPNVIIEAQANGVPCVISDTITSEVKILENVTILPIQKKDEWTKNILTMKRIDSIKAQKELKKKGYDIETVVEAYVSSVFGRI